VYAGVPLQGVQQLQKANARLHLRKEQSDWDAAIYKAKYDKVRQQRRGFPAFPCAWWWPGSNSIIMLMQQSAVATAGCAAALACSSTSERKHSKQTYHVIILSFSVLLLICVAA
jgi:hypothetical protein